MFYPIKDNKFTIEIYDMDLNKIKMLNDNNIIEQKSNSIVFTGIINNDNFEGIIGYEDESVLNLYFNNIQFYCFTSPKMVKAIDMKELTNIGNKINLYGFSNTQKLELECMNYNTIENYWFYNAKVYDNNKIIKMGTGKLYQDVMTLILNFDDNTHLQGIITPLGNNKSIGISMKPGAVFSDRLVYYFDR